MANDREIKVDADVASPTILQYVYDHAPLFHLHPTDRYHPTPLSTFLTHTRPQLSFQDIPSPSPLTLSNLSHLNAIGAKGGEDIYLTSLDDVTRDPGWLGGGSREGEGESGVVIIVEKEKEEGVVDVFYFIFFAFNWGGIVLNHQLGDHVGDWEHVMLRFVDGTPRYAWLSQHANGEAYTFSALEKNGDGKRPILYIAKGSHAIYPTPGPTDHTFPNLNLNIPFLLVDNCDTGPIYDPIPNSYIYNCFIPPSSSPPSSSSGKPPASTFTFSPLTPTSPPPSWLHFTGHWGDAAYPASDARQKGKNLLGIRRYGNGPTGPGDKGLERREVWPRSTWEGGQRVREGLRGVGEVEGDGKEGWWERVRRGGCFGKKGKGKGKRRVDVDGKVVG